MMMNQRLLGIFAVLTLLLPLSVQSLIEETRLTVQTQNNEENTALASGFMSVLGSADSEQAEQPVAIAASKEIEDTPTPEEERRTAIQDWLKDIPQIEGDSTPAQFINEIAPAAILIANEHGIYPSVMMAQAGLESSWGRSELAQEYNNLMGTKGSWEGESITVRTREDVGGESDYIDAGFSVYNSWTDSLRRYGLLMANGTKTDPAIYEGTWRENAATYQDATAWLQGRYATDTSYADKLNRTIQSFGLNQFDEIEPLETDLDELLAQLTNERETSL